MKLWKGATFAFMLCGAALSTILIKNMATVGLKTKNSRTSSSSSRESSSLESTSRSSPSSTSSSSVELRKSGGLHRRIRSTDNMNSFLSELSVMFQSFTEGELQRVVETLLDSKKGRSRRLGKNQARRTKRDHRPKPCSVRKLQLTVTELGLGYKSEETLPLHYCTGNCQPHRQNYDMIMKHMIQMKFIKKGKVNKGPCCRPTAFEDFSFWDDNNKRFQTLQNFSAKSCGCV
ncbi:neurturin-like [Parambassis ranga]|uniref:Neurturin-like n=1 Tax=Parambassis ranga TaxID=210632 RepID=A0A6P7K370_9TELE|nr:neurturin-like [Parambassis ranga]